MDRGLALHWHGGWWGATLRPKPPLLIVGGDKMLFRKTRSSRFLAEITQYYRIVRKPFIFSKCKNLPRNGAMFNLP